MINDINYLAVVNQEARELRDQAAQNRLAREAKDARRQQRAVERENRLLERAVNGKVDRWGQLLDLLRIGRLTRSHQRFGATSTGRSQDGRAKASSTHC